MGKINFIRLFACFMLLCLIANIVVAQKKNVLLEGRVVAPSDSDFIDLKHYEKMDIHIKVDDQGVFKMNLESIEPSFYMLDKVGMIYLKPGYRLKVNPRKDSSYVFSGEGSKANNILGTVRAAVGNFFPYDKKGLTQEAYYLEPSEFKKRMNALEQYAAKSIAAVDDQFFVQIATKDFHYFCRSIWQQYNQGYGIDQQKKELYNKVKDGTANESYTSAERNALYNSMFVKRMDSVSRNEVKKLAFEDLDWNDGQLLRNSEAYRRAVEYGILYAMYTPKYSRLYYTSPSKEDKLQLRRKIAQDMISDTTVLAYCNFVYVAGMLKIATKAELIDSLYRSFIAAEGSTSSQKQMIASMYRNRIAYSAGSLAPDFTYTSIDGKNVSLSSLRGKYVYIDVWATWCGPCKAEIPPLMKIEQDYQGKQIQFVSLSIDKPSDHQKWKDYVRAHELKGIQVIADNAIHSEFLQKFNINAIPHFILIGPDGKIVSAKAKRPSDPALRQQLDELL